MSDGFQKAATDSAGFESDGNPFLSDRDRKRLWRQEERLLEQQEKIEELKRNLKEQRMSEFHSRLQYEARIETLKQTLVDLNRASV